MPLVLVAFTALVAIVLSYIILSTFFGPLSRIPGPKSFALTKWRLAYEDYTGNRTRTFNALHRRYGPVVRVGPNELTFNSTSALRVIYGAGSGFERTRFYQMFEVYGRKNMFSFSSVREHGARKKLFAHAYAKSVLLKGNNAALVEGKVKRYMELIERGPTIETFSTLHYFSLDTITEFLYGKFGKTCCMEGVEEDRALIEDIADPARRKLAWYAVHFPGFTSWLYSRTGFLGCITRQFYPMQTPTTYSSIRHHALKACQDFSNAPVDVQRQESSLIANLWKHHRSQRKDGIDDLDIASECADHLLAGIDTTSDTSMFVVWSLSRPENKTIQEKLIEEVRNIPEENLNVDGVPRTEVSDKLPFVNAVIQETLRLYAPLPGSEPRTVPPIGTTIDGYMIPPNTVVSISPYTLHRNPDVFKDPSKFDPERWLDGSNASEMKKWFWAFSSGGRMCIGMHLAMAEMTTLVASIYRKYTTTAHETFSTVSPGITARYEIFYEENCSGMREHECWIQFNPLEQASTVIAAS